MQIDLRRRFEELQGLDLQNPGAWPDWVRTAAAVLLAAALIAGSYWYLIAERYAEAERAARTEQELRSELETKQRRAAALDAYRARLEQMERDFGEMLRQLPGKAEVANLLNDISRTRSANNLDEEIFEPQSEVVRDFYAELPNRIVVVGSFHDMARFVSDIAELSRIVTIEQVEITRVGGEAGDSDAPTELRMSATAKTYRYLDDEELAAQRGNARGGRR
jgi:type IV pilus assembly protein PilO